MKEYNQLPIEKLLLDIIEACIADLERAGSNKQKRMAATTQAYEE